MKTRAEAKADRLAPLILASVATLGMAPFTCSPLSANWGLDAINTMTTPPDPPLACSFTIPADPGAEQRTACAFGQGDHASTSLGVPSSISAQIPVRHVIVMMKENRSFDHLFGHLHDLQPETEAVPDTFTNPDLQGNPVMPFHLTTTCEPLDPGHQYASVVECMFAGGTTPSMIGFVINAAKTSQPATLATDGHYVMGYYQSADFPFYSWLATTYALADRHFAPMDSGTYANRNFFLLGTNAGVVDTSLTYPDPSTPSIMRLLMNAGFTWGVYSDDPSGPLEQTLGWATDAPGVHPVQALLDALDQGTLPNVAFVDGTNSVTDDHASDNTTPNDVQAGEAWSRNIYQHATSSPAWSRLAIIWTYDEAGGFADHVLPPSGCLARPSTSPFTQMGPRIPLVAISRWAKRHYVSHAVRDHTAITRFIETVFDLPALTGRDANSDALLDLFDFSCTQAATPPGPVPEAGTGGCQQ